MITPKVPEIEWWSGPASALPRHTLVWIDKRAHDDARAAIGDAGAHGALDEWLDREWPFVVRRREKDEADLAGAVPLGFPQPRDRGVRGHALAVPADALARIEPPLSLRRVFASLPVPWRDTLDRLERSAHWYGIRLRVCGSMAWQAMTGLPFVAPDSDIDVIAIPRDRSMLERTLRALTEFARDRDVVIDGEIVFPGHDAVSWREWIDPKDANDVIVKHRNGVRLVRRNDLLARLGSA